MQGCAPPGGAPPLPLQPGVSRARRPAGVELPRRRNHLAGGWSSLMAAASQANKGGAPRRRPPPPTEPPTWPGAGGAPSQPVSRPGQATRPGAGLLHQERSSLRGDAEPRPRSTVASGQRVDRSATRPLPQGRCPLMF
jgi:hypothetical protein